MTTGIPPTRQNASSMSMSMMVICNKETFYSTVRSAKLDHNSKRKQNKIMRTMLTILNIRRMTSREGLASRTSKIASMPCALTNCRRISGTSVMMLIWNTASRIFRSILYIYHGPTNVSDWIRTSWSQASLRVKSGDCG